MYINYNVTRAINLQQPLNILPPWKCRPNFEDPRTNQDKPKLLVQLRPLRSLMPSDHEHRTVCLSCALLCHARLPIAAITYSLMLDTLIFQGFKGKDVVLPLGSQLHSTASLSSFGLLFEATCCYSMNQGKSADKAG